MRRLLTAALVVLTACAPLDTAPAPAADVGAVVVPADASSGVVERVVDGDTLIAEVDGERERIRLLRIDAPEVARDGDPGECLGDAATAALTELLPPGARIDLATDVEVRDRYGRLLAHVWVDGTWVNGTMLATGFADVLTIPPNVAHDDEVRAAAADARRGAVGLWDPSRC